MPRPPRRGSAAAAARLRPAARCPMTISSSVAGRPAGAPTSATTGVRTRVSGVPSGAGNEPMAPSAEGMAPAAGSPSTTR